MPLFILIQSINIILHLINTETPFNFMRSFF